MAGLATGAVLLALERSPTFHVFADVLNATFRILGRHFAEATIVRLDTGGVAAALYVGGHGLLGTVLGAIAAIAFRGTAARILAIAAGLVLADGLVFGSVWRHRLLPGEIGWTLVAAAAVAGAVAAAAAGIAVRGAPARLTGLLAGALPAAIAIGVGVTLVTARGGPRRPEAVRVEDPSLIETGQKVAILGVDGLDRELVNEAVAAGRMPNLAALLERGTRGSLRSIRPPKSPVVWTTIATGMLPSRHGIRDFVMRRDGQAIPVTSNLRRRPALWNIARDAGFTVAFLNWYVTWPAEPVAGLLVSDRADFDGLERRVFPEPFTAVVDSVRGRIETLSRRDPTRFTRPGTDLSQWMERRWGQVRRSLRVLDDVIRHDLVTLETARVALASGQPDLTALYFRGNDNTQHLFWKYRLARTDGRVASLLYEDLSPGDVARLGEVVDRYYDFMDELIGEVVGLLEPDTAILVLSDHGFLTNNERARWYHPNRILEAAGIAVLEPGGGGVADSAASRVYEPGAPTISPFRILRPGGRADDPEAALEAAWDVLESVRTERDEPVFAELELGGDEHGPWLGATFASGLAGDSVRVAGERLPMEDVQTPEGHSGDHAMDGFLLATGPPFHRNATIKGARALDMAPTVLHLLGAPVGADMDGIVLQGLFTIPWRDAHPIREIETWGVRESGIEAIATDVDQKIRDELEALGYLGGGTPP